MNLTELKALHQKMMADKESRGKGGEDFLAAYIKLTEGNNLVRILPSKTDEKPFFAEVSVHKYKDAEDKWHNYYCPKTESKACPFCDLVQDLWATHKTLKLPFKEKSKYGDLATKIKAKPRYYVNVVDRKIQELKDPTQSPVKILVMAKDLFELVISALVDPEFLVEGEEQDTTLISLTKGNDFQVIMTKKGEYPDFSTSKPRFKKTPAGTKQEIDTWMGSLHDIHSMGKAGDYEEGKKIAMTLRAGLETISEAPKKSEGSDNGDTSEQKFKDNMKV